MKGQETERLAACLPHLRSLAPVCRLAAHTYLIEPHRATGHADVSSSLHKSDATLLSSFLPRVDFCGNLFRFQPRASAD